MGDVIFSEMFVLTGNVKGKDGRMDLVLFFDNDTKIEMGKLSMWRICFGDISWIDDFIDNYGKDYNFNIKETNYIAQTEYEPTEQECGF